MSDQSPRTFTTEFKEQAVLRVQAGEPFTALAAELGVRRKLLTAIIAPTQMATGL